MFSADTVLGMVIGILVIAGGTYLAVRGHLARERREAADEDPPPR